MGDFSAGFWTGFMNTTAEGIGKRQDSAQAYFDQQLQLAHTRGIENKRKMDAAMKQGLTSARQLVQMGVPENMVKAIANQNPDDIPDFAAKIAQLQADGVRTDEAFFKDLIQVNSEFENNEDLNSFFKRIYQPLRRNVQADPEGFNNDQRGTIWATMFGYDAMEQALGRLDRTEVMDGMTAGDLLALDPDQLQQPLGTNPVTLDYGKFGDSTRAARAALKTSTPLSPAGIKTVMETFEGFVTEATVTAGEAGQTTDLSPEQMLDINRQAAVKTLEMFGPKTVSQIPPITKFLQEQNTVQPEEKAVPERQGLVPRPVKQETAVPKPSDVPTVGVPEVAPPASTPPTPASPGGVNVQPQADNWNDPFVLPNGAVFVQMLNDGTVILRMPDGKHKRVPQEEVMVLIGQ